jgi:hypothetical protein
MMGETARMWIAGSLSVYITDEIIGVPTLVLDTSGAFNPHIALGRSAALELRDFLVEHAPTLGEMLEGWAR